jgi:DNA-binding transcriptional ArsR family regulator
MNTDVVFRALSDPQRRAIFERLMRAEFAVKELTAKFDISQPAVSQHLAALRTAGLVVERHEGRRVYYKAQKEGLKPLVNWISHYQAFWNERVDVLKDVLDQMEKPKKKRKTL